MGKFPKKAYGHTFYCSPCISNGKDAADNTMIPLKTWCEENNFSRSQAINLLKKNVLLGMTYKGKMFVMLNPDLNAQLYLNEYHHRKNRKK